MTTHPQTMKGEFAGFASRFVAFAIDLAIIIVMSGIIVWVIVAALDLIGVDVTQPAAQASNDFWRIVSVIAKIVIALLPITLLLVYWLIFWTVTGQTVGKRIMGVRIVRIDGQHMKMSNSLRRIVMYFVSMIPFFLGFFWILFEDQRRGWHDKFAGTCVIYAWNAREVEKFMDATRRRVDQVEQHPLETQAVEQDSAETTPDLEPVTESAEPTQTT